MSNDGSEAIFEVAVVGTGMIGAAAVRHLADSGVSVVGIGAVEPDDWRPGIGPFSSHYDAGRITRITANNPFWAAAAAASTARYGEVEARSGISFHQPCGLAWVAVAMEQSLAVGRANGADVIELDSDELLSRTGIAAPAIDGVRCAFESAPAGLVDPRAHVAAELAAAQGAGATIVGAAVRQVSRSASTGEFSLAGSFGEVRASRLLLATGAYGADFMGVGLDMTRKLRTIVRAEIGPGTDIPSLIAHDVTHEALDGIYWVPPVEYPDGRTMIKIGGDYVPVRTADSVDEVNAWFGTDGCLDEAAALLETLRALLPGAEIATWNSQPCVVTTTPTELPYIGWIDDNVCVAVVGNGAAAKSCDELGRLAASYVMTEWDDEDLDAAEFEPRIT